MRSLEVCYGKAVSEFAVTPEGGETIGPIEPGETKKFDYSVPAELITALKEDQDPDKRTAADFSGIFKITEVEPNELADENNTGLIESDRDRGS